MLRTFEKSDWYGFAGCEPFADGGEPLINDRDLVLYSPDAPPVGGIVIVDANGIGVYDEEGTAYHHASLGSREADAAFAEFFLGFKNVTAAFLEQHGFVRVN